MILHLADDNRFMNHVINMFELASPNGNQYFIHVDNNNDKLKFITNTENENIIISNSEDELFTGIISDLDKYDAVIFHNLISKYKFNILRKANKSIHFQWMSWGADIYCSPEYLSNKNLKGKIGDFLNNYFPSFWYKFYLKNNNLELDCLNKSLAKKIKSVSTVVPTESSFITKYFNKSIIFKSFKYGTIEQLLIGNIKDIVNGNNMLIGNSATSTNNHLEVLNIVKDNNYIFNIYIPLSYGDEGYKQKIINISESYFGDQAFPLVDNLPLNKYNDIIRSCGIVIMNHKRQQAVGNIIASLWLGARVFLNISSPVYAYFKSIGIKVFQIDELRKISELPSNKHLANTNRPILHRLYSHHKVLEETIDLVKYLTKE